MDESVNQFPEQVARDNIDKQLHAAGWDTVISEMNEALAV
jgi:type I site-specific restriction endonuclease